MTGKASEPTFGIGPTDSENSWNWPGAMPPPGTASNSTTDTVCVILSPSSATTGGSSVAVVAL